MKIFEYDIYDGDKGIIIANDEAEAIRIFKNNYENAVVSVDVTDYNSGTCSINEVAELENNPQLYFIHD